MNFFGKKRQTGGAAPTPAARGGGGGGDPTSTIIQLRESLATLDKREDHIQKKADAMVEEAKKKLAAKDKKGALFSMKRKKMYESEVEKIMNSKMTLETQIMSLETQIQNIETFKAMKAGKTAMEAVRKGVDVDNVDEMMDDIREEMEQANEISQAIGQPVDGAEFDEDELLSELNELEENDLEEAMLSKPGAAALDMPAYALPSAPAGGLQAKGVEEDEDEKALRELEASLAM
ncbi:hypothetical protein TeGR_g3204 [Tetraparma gracilis]|uniref:Uncharacterized protein n=1 Tax=Tetraparma gracilis TaxID=2962635 RepID=A0ABQ6M7X4_9STRA|nr:hypothetical protein TeGR_g3204 [Tetraparma gracilis]